MITVRELAKKLWDYANENPENARMEVMVAFDGHVAFPFLEGRDHKAFGPNGVARFFVMYPDERGGKLVLKGRE